MAQETMEKYDFVGMIDKDNGIRTRISERYKYAKAHYDSWMEEAKDDYQFALGDQWAPEDRETLNREMRPCLTFNRIRPLINLVSGYQRENSARIKVNPEGGEDRVFSEVMDRILKAVDKWSHLSYKLGYQFDDGCYCGKGFIEAIIEYDKDPIRGELNFKQRSPYQILPDPDGTTYDMNEGHRYCIKPVRLTKAELLELYPKKKNVIEALSQDSVEDDPTESISEGVIIRTMGDDYNNRKDRITESKNVGEDDESGLEEDGKFLVKEYWERKMVDKFFVIDKEAAEPRRFDDEEEAQVFADEQGFGKVIKRKVPEMRVSALCAGWILQDEELSPFEPLYSGFPFFRFLADWAPNADNEVSRVQGITRPLKDPQKEKNKAKSQNLHILNTQANSGWIVDEDSLVGVDAVEELKRMGSKPGLVIVKKSGKEVREIMPKGPNAGHIQREQAAEEEFYRISTINPDLMGMKEGDLSGRAMSMRIKQGVLSLARIFYNYKYTKEILGRFILQMIPNVFDTKKAVRVLGPHYLKTAVDPERYPEGLTEGHIRGFLQLVKDHKYDVYVSEAGDNSTIRHEIFLSLIEMAKAGMPIPPDLIIDYLDLPNSEEVKLKIKDAQQQALAAQQAKENSKGK